VGSWIRRLQVETQTAFVRLLFGAIDSFFFSSVFSANYQRDVDIIGDLGVLGLRRRYQEADKPSDC
jgi:hypothetical protein